MMTVSPNFYSNISNDKAVPHRPTKEVVEVTRSFLAQEPIRGENPEVFKYRLRLDEDECSYAFAGMFYDFFEVYSYSSQAASNEIYWIRQIKGTPEVKIKHTIIAAISLFLVSCASINPVSFQGPNGKQAYTMRCSGIGRTLEMCYQKAGEVCPGGYNIIGQDSSTVAVPINGSIMAAPRQNLTIECK